MEDQESIFEQVANPVSDGPAVPPMQLMEISEDAIIVEQDAVITFKNFQQLKSNVESYVESYKNLVMKDDSEYNQFKKNRGTLNKGKKILETLRIKVKNQVLTPYENLKKQVDELEGIIDGANANIVNQINDYEIRMKESKREDIKKIFKDLQEDYPAVDFITLDDIWTDKWHLQKFKLQDIFVIIESDFIQINNDIKIINLDENGARIKAVYLDNGFELAEAKVQVLQSIKMEIENQAKINAEMSARNLVIEQSRIEEIEVQTKEAITNSQEIPDVVVEKQITIKLSITGNRSKLKEIIDNIKSVEEIVIKQL